jgi:hypothetical protein
MLDPMKTSLPPRWAIPFTMTLRSRDVTGAAIGDALRHAESFCADSGQPPQDAFGDPVRYAESLTDLPTLPTSGLAARLTNGLAPNLVGLVGLLLVLPTFDGWRAGHDTEITTGLLVSMFVTLGVVLVILLRPSVMRRSASFATLIVIGWLAVVAAPILLKGVAARVPLTLSAPLAVLALVGSGMWQMRTLDIEEIQDPLAPTRGVGKGSRAFRLVTSWLFLLGSFVAICIGLLVPAR